MKIYLIGSLRNPSIVEIGNALRAEGFEVVDDWSSPGPEADDKWQEYERARGRSYKEALNGLHAKHVFAFDRHHLETSDIVVMVMPAGRSGHLELGWSLGQGKPGYILFDAEPDRYDVMYLFATDIFFDLNSLLLTLRAHHQAWLNDR